MGPTEAALHQHQPGRQTKTCTCSLKTYLQKFRLCDDCCCCWWWCNVGCNWMTFSHRLLQNDSRVLIANWFVHNTHTWMIIIHDWLGCWYFSNAMRGARDWDHTKGNNSRRKNSGADRGAWWANTSPIFRRQTLWLLHKAIHTYTQSQGAPTSTPM